MGRKNTFSFIRIFFLIFSVLMLVGCSKAQFNSSEDPSTLGPDSDQDDNNNGNTNNPNSPPPAADFRKGDVFDPAKPPVILQGEVVQEINQYALANGFRAVVLSANGFGVAQGVNAANQDEANQVLLERCQLESNNQPCAVFAEGSFLKYDKADFFNSFASVLETGPRAFDAMKVPGMQFSDRNFLQDAPNGYVQAPQPFKALAIGIDGAAGIGKSTFGQAHANRRALEQCEVNRDTPTCTLYAEGDQVLFNVGSFNLSTTKILQYGPIPFNPATVPFVNDENRANDMVDAQNAINNGQGVVVSVNRFGYFNVAIGAAANAALEQQAINACEATVPDVNPSFKCFVYSVNGLVTMTRQRLIDNSF